MQKPSVHYQGSGCPSCKNELTASRSTRNLEWFITRARATHGNKYDYSQTVYLGSARKLIIICPQHGAFEQQASSHYANGSGCPKCSRDDYRAGWIVQAAGKRAILYFLHFFSDSEEFYKIGITFHSIKKRYGRKQDLSGYQYEILAQHPSQDAARVYDWEQSILETFAHLRYKPKRPFQGASECFSSADPILAIFPL